MAQPSQHLAQRELLVRDAWLSCVILPYHIVLLDLPQVYGVRHVNRAVKLPPYLLRIVVWVHAKAMKGGERWPKIGCDDSTHEPLITGGTSPQNVSPSP